jgi:hypothetical protein
MKKAGGTATRKNERLALAGKNVLVEFTRSVEEGSVVGYVLAIGAQFFLLALVEDNARFNGFQCLRCKMSEIFGCQPNMQRSLKQPYSCGVKSAPEPLL